MFIGGMDFEGPLAVGEKLAVLAYDPAFRVALEVLPAQGLATKRSLTETAGTLLVGAASVLFGADRRADAEMRYQWPLLRRALRSARIDIPDEAIPTQHLSTRSWYCRVSRIPCHLRWTRWSGTSKDAGYRNVRAKTVDWRGRAILVTQFDSDFDHDGTVTSVSTSHAALTLDSRSFMVIVTSSARDADGLSDVVLQVAESIRDQATP